MAEDSVECKEGAGSLIEPTIHVLKTQSKIVSVEQDCGASLDVTLNNTKKELISEFLKAKGHSSARLYSSLSRLINCSAWCLAAITLIFVIWWAALEWQITYCECSEVELQRLSNLITKFESLFSYLLTTALGFAGGVCKMFLRQNES